LANFRFLLGSGQWDFGPMVAVPAEWLHYSCLDLLVKGLEQTLD
jgi:hypothetical protein